MGINKRELVDILLCQYNNRNDYEYRGKVYNQSQVVCLMCIKRINEGGMYASRSELSVMMGLSIGMFGNGKNILDVLLRDSLVLEKQGKQSESGLLVSALGDDFLGCYLSLYSDFNLSPYIPINQLIVGDSNICGKGKNLYKSININNHSKLKKKIVKLGLLPILNLAALVRFGIGLNLINFPKRTFDLKFIEHYNKTLKYQYSFGINDLIEISATFKELIKRLTILCFDIDREVKELIKKNED